MALAPVGIRDPSPSAAEPLADLDIDTTLAPDPNDETIIIDTATGHIKTVNPDGSLTVAPIGKPKRTRTGARQFHDNLAEEMDSLDLAGISMRLLDGIENDIRSRRDWEETAQKGASLIGVKLEEASSDIGTDGAISKVKHTGLLQACLSIWASSRAELLPVNGPVKVRDDQITDQEEDPPGMMGHNGGPPLEDDLTNVVPGPGSQLPGAAAPPPPDQGGIADAFAGLAGIAGGGNALPPGIIGPSKQEKRNKLADALEHDMNHYLTVIDKDYYPDTSRMLMSRGLLGCQFKKVYRDPLLRRPVSRWVKGVDLIVSNEATSLTGAARVTERIPTRQSVVRRLQVLGHWRDIPLVVPTTEITPMERKVAEVEGVQKSSPLTADQLHTIYEIYAELDEGDLKKDDRGKTPGFPLPYRITIDKDSRVVLEIRRNWKKGDENYTPRRRYVKFGLVPGLGFYDWGFVHLIGNPQRAASMINQNLIDTGILNTFPGGVMAKSPGTRQRTTEIRPSYGQFIVMDTGGLPIDQFVMPWPYKEPSAVLAAKEQDLVSQMKQVAGVVELPVGEGRIGNTPVGTIMAYIDAVSKVPSAVHKDDHIAQQEEFELLKELFAEEPEALWRGAKRPRRKWIAQEIMDQDLVPAADPNIPSQTHRLMQAAMLVDIGEKPQFAGIANQRGIWEHTIRTIGASNTGEFTIPPPPPGSAPPPPDPKVVVQQMKGDLEKTKMQAAAANDERDHTARMEEIALESADESANRDAENTRALLKHTGERAALDAKVHMHGAGIKAEEKRHGDEMGVRGHEAAQDHVHHMTELEAAAADRLAAAAQPETTGVT